jgi:hypothetical protein
MPRHPSMRVKAAYAAGGLLLLWILPGAIEFFFVHLLGARSPFKSIQPNYYFFLGVFVVGVWLVIEAIAWLSRKKRW